VPLPQRPPPPRPPPLRCPARARAPDCCAGWVGSVGPISLRRGRQRCGRWFAAVAAREPRSFAVWARVAPSPKRVDRTAGQAAAARREAVAALRAAPTRGARRRAARPVVRRRAVRPAARRRAARQAPGAVRAPRAVPARRAVPAPHEARGPPRAGPALLLLACAAARRRLSPSQQKR